MSGTAYVVLSHRDPAQVERLAAAITGSSPTAHVLVTHDGRRSAAPRPADRVRVRTHGLPTDWGSWELVEATLDAFAWARRTVDPEMVVLISGQDYPVRDLAAWEREFLATGGGWAGRATPLSYRPRWGRRRGEGDDDLTRYVYGWYRLPATGLAQLLPPGLERARRRVRGAVLLRAEPVLSWRHVTRGRGAHLGIRRWRTPFSPARPCCKGPQMVAMDRAALDHLLTETAPGTALRRYFRRTVIPDEALIQSVLAWRAPPREGWQVSYDHWVPSIDTTRELGTADLPAILASGAAFCRKVDRVRSAALIQALDDRRAAAPGRLDAAAVPVVRSGRAAPGVRPSRG